MINSLPHKTITVPRLEYEDFSEGWSVQGQPPARTLRIEVFQVLMLHLRRGQGGPYPRLRGGTNSYEAELIFSLASFERSDTNLGEIYLCLGVSGQRAVASLALR